MLQSENAASALKATPTTFPFTMPNSLPIGSFPPTRATEVVRLLIVKNGFDAHHLSAAGYAEYRPTATNTTPEGRAMNRRVDIVILSEDLPLAPSITERAKKPSASVP